MGGCSDQKGGPGSQFQGVVSKFVWKGDTYNEDGSLDDGQVGKELGTITMGHGKLTIYSVQGEPTSKEISVVQPTTDGYTLYKK